MYQEKYFDRKFCTDIVNCQCILYSYFSQRCLSSQATDLKIFISWLVICGTHLYVQRYTHSCWRFLHWPSGFQTELKVCRQLTKRCDHFKIQRRYFSIYLAAGKLVWATAAIKYLCPVFLTWHTYWLCLEFPLHDPLPRTVLTSVCIQLLWHKDHPFRFYSKWKRSFLKTRKMYKHVSHCNWTFIESNLH